MSPRRSQVLSQIISLTLHFRISVITMLASNQLFFLLSYLSHSCNPCSLYLAEFTSHWTTILRLTFVSFPPSIPLVARPQHDLSCPHYRLALLSFTYAWYHYCLPPTVPVSVRRYRLLFYLGSALYYYIFGGTANNVTTR